MIRGQSEYVGAVILISLVLVITYVATDWLNTLYNAAKSAVESVEYAKEVLDVVLNKDIVTVVNKGSRESLIDLMYVELRNRTLVVKDVDKVVKPGESIGITVGFNHTNVGKVCIETVYNNVFCSIQNNNSYDLHQYRGFWSYERVSPIYLGSKDQNHLVYRVKRIVAPDTWFYVYAVPEENVVVTMFEEDILHTLGKYYIGTRPSDLGESSYISIICTTCSVTPELLIDGDDSTAGIHITGAPNVLDICIDLGEPMRGWLYVYAYLRGSASASGAQASIVLSNKSCIEINSVNTTLYWLPKPTTIRGVWLINTRSIRFYSRNYTWDIYTLELYPYNVTKTVLGFPSTKHQKPTTTTISLFALSNTWIQMLELTMLPKINNT